MGVELQSCWLCGLTLPLSGRQGSWVACREVIGACPLEGFVCRPLRLRQQLFKFISGEINFPQYLY
jgi:hypothetical protein